MRPDAEDRQTLRELAGATMLEDELSRALPPLRGLKWLIVIFLLAATGACLYAAVALDNPTAGPAHSRAYWQALAIGLASGVLTFTVLPLVLMTAKRARRVLLVLGTIVGVAAIAEAYWIDDDLCQALVMEAGLAILLVVALDLLIAHALANIAEREERLRQNLAAARKKVESAESELDYKYAWHDYLGLPRPDQMPYGPDFSSQDDE